MIFPALSTMMGKVNDFNPDLLVEFQDVSVVRNRTALVGPIDWSVDIGERWVVIGPNGAGKTTLIRLAGAEEFPSTGDAYIFGEKLGRTDMRDLRTMIGMSSSALASRIPANEKVLDLVVFAGYAILGRWREEYAEMDFSHADRVLDQVGATHLRERTWGTLSEGEKKRVLIARALMTNPELLLLDEPGAGLDLGGREDLVGYLAELAQDEDAPAIVMITHHVEDIPAGFTHALLLRNGRAVAAGPISQVLTSENLSTTFDQPIQLDHVDGRYFARRGN